MKPGSASYPFFGVVPALLDDEGKELTGAAEGHLVFKRYKNCLADQASLF